MLNLASGVLWVAASGWGGAAAAEQPSSSTGAEAQLEKAIRDSETDIWALAMYGARIKHKALTERPAFTGNGLLLGGATSLGLAVLSGIWVSVLQAKDWDVCGGLRCRGAQFEGWRLAGGYVLLAAGAGSLGLGVAGSVLRGRYDAWRTVVKDGPILNTPVFYLGGASLLAAGSGLGFVSLLVFVDSDSRIEQVTWPLMLTGSIICSTAGAGLISYAAAHAVRARWIEQIMAVPLVDRNTGAAGLALTGRF